MEKIYLLKIEQNGHERFLGRADARTLAQMAKKAELGTTQEAQRPIKPKRLEDLATFVQDGGTLSTSIVIGTLDDRIKVYPVDDKGVNGVLYYTEFPETESESQKMEDSFDIMDGQHRLFSFLPEHCKISDDIKYELSFEMYLQPSLQERRTIFQNTNEKQESVDPNLLMWFKAQLNLLSDKEKAYYGVVSLLNEDHSSPLCGRIIMSAEHITGGYKSNQLINLFNKVKLKSSINAANLDDNQLFIIITRYLRGWEDAADSKLADRETKLGAFSKMAGMRFMIDLLPTFFDVALTNHEKFTEKFVTNKVNELFAGQGITVRDLFDRSSNYNKAQGTNPFSGETNTNALAEFYKEQLKNLGNNVFDPLA